jgi:hypothetical protein
VEWLKVKALSSSPSTAKKKKKKKELHMVTAVIPAIRRTGEPGGYEFKASLGCVLRPSLEKQGGQSKKE